MKIIKQQKNPFLHREEYVIEVESKTTPSFQEIKTELGKDQDLIVVKEIKGNFGSHTFNAEAVVYDSKEFKEQVEKIPRKIKLKLAEEAKKAAPAA